MRGSDHVLLAQNLRTVGLWDDGADELLTVLETECRTFIVDGYVVGQETVDALLLLDREEQRCY